MLKPTKKITKKEIQRDPFLETVDKAQTYFEEKKNLLFLLLAGIVVFIMAFNFYGEKRGIKDAQASAALGQALVALDRGDVDNALFQFETILSEYKGTAASEQAEYHIGKQKYESGDYESAKSYLSSFLSAKPVDIMLPSTSTMLANIAMIEEDTKNSLSYFDRAIRATTDKHIKRMVTIRKADFNYSIGNIEDAKSLAKGILSEKDITPVERQAAEELLGKISS